MLLFQLICFSIFMIGYGNGKFVDIRPFGEDCTLHNLNGEGLLRRSLVLEE